ncbi:hypothetical protein L1987_38007 [Smallanthus sonchifolius]|uniref:Uncharacterized protein n=1 Tax=Smallanthus sonchifolius TaxID=185202 RepID=A0ACB9HJC1_9ASTR|nr:hypothetical protein L1987_38007 [Smallanthus sonchifolius]
MSRKRCPCITYRGFYAHSSGIGEQLHIQIPNEKVGVIIGKGSETIKNLQTRPGARIQLIPQHLPEGDQSNERTVRVTGGRKQIEMAREMIKEIMDQPGPDSIGFIAISHGYVGVAAHACGLVGLEPTRPSWFCDCLDVDVLNVLTTGNNGTVELLYMQLSAPTTLAPTHDFLILRYTSALEDGAMLVCVKTVFFLSNLYLNLLVSKEVP